MGHRGGRTGCHGEYRRAAHGRCADANALLGGASMHTRKVVIALCGLVIVHSDLAHAQRTEENAVKAAEDAFGVTIGRETLGLYTTTSVRGFSPTAAGNARINGLYFDQVWALNARLRSATTI